MGLQVRTLLSPKRHSLIATKVAIPNRQKRKIDILSIDFLHQLLWLYGSITRNTQLLVGIVLLRD